MLCRQPALPPPRKCQRKSGCASKRELATIVKRRVENKFYPGFDTFCSRAAGKSVEVFVAERLRNCPVAQTHKIQDFPVVARSAGRNEPKVGVCLTIPAGQFFQFGGAFRAAKSAFQHRRVFRLGGGHFRHGAIILHLKVLLRCCVEVFRFVFLQKTVSLR